MADNALLVALIESLYRKIWRLEAMHPKVASLDARMTAAEDRWDEAKPVWDAEHAEIGTLNTRVGVLEAQVANPPAGGLAADDEAALTALDSRLEVLAQEVADYKNTRTVANA